MASLYVESVRLQVMRFALNLSWWPRHSVCFYQDLHLLCPLCRLHLIKPLHLTSSMLLFISQWKNQGHCVLSEKGAAEPLQTGIENLSSHERLRKITYLQRLLIFASKALSIFFILLITCQCDMGLGSSLEAVTENNDSAICGKNWTNMNLLISMLL